MGVFRFNEVQWEFVKRFIPEQHMGRPRTRNEDSALQAARQGLQTAGQDHVLIQSQRDKVGVSSK
jgi:hypothetical protein